MHKNIFELFKGIFQLKNYFRTIEEIICLIGDVHFGKLNFLYDYELIFQKITFLFFHNLT